MTPKPHSMSPRDALLHIADEIEAGRETQLSPEKIRAVAEGATTRQGTGLAVLVGSAASGASPQHEVGDALIQAIVLGIDCDHQGCTDRTEAHAALASLEEQLEAAQDGWKAAASLNADVTRFGKALTEIVETPVEESARNEWTRELQRIARDALNPATKTHGRGCPCTPCQAEDWDAIDAGLRASSPASEPEAS